MKDPRQVSAEWVEAINRQDLGALSRTLHLDFVWELGVSSTEGAEASLKAWRLWFAAFPDIRFKVLQAIAEGPAVCLRRAWRGPISANCASGASAR